MPKILGMNTTIGEKPKPLTSSCLKSFNDIFCRLVNELKKAKTISYTPNEHDYSDEESFKYHGYFTYSRVIKWLGYFQLVHLTKTKEPREDAEGKFQTVWTVKLTKLGRQVHRKGEVVEVELNYTGTLKLGIGKDYTSFDPLWKRVLDSAEAGGVSKSRRENWYSEFREFWTKQLISLTTVAATEKLDKWARVLIAKAPKMRRRRKSLKSPINDAVNHQLTKWA